MFVRIGDVGCNGQGPAEVRDDLLATRYREAGVVAPALDLPWQAQMITPAVPLSLPDSFDMARLSSASEIYQSRSAETVPPWQSQMITTAVPLPDAAGQGPWQVRMVTTAVPNPG